MLLANLAGAAFQSALTPGVENMAAVTSWFAVVFYAMQIFFDFSGYSDMALGLGKMFGFKLTQNFRYPFYAESISDFWRRWHMSLSSWFREYIYIPLGGNRKGLARQIFNMAGVWFLTGLWHGAAWNFVLWGVFYFVLLVVEKTFLLKFFGQNKLTSALGHIWALVLVGIGWMIFDHTDLSEIWSILQALVGIGTVGFAPCAVSYELLHALPLLMIGVIAATPFPALIWRRIKEKHESISILEPVLTILLLVLAIAAMVSGTYSPFLYFNF